MAATKFFLGTTDELKALYSFSCNKDPDETLSQTINHWFEQTLKRDGYELKAGQPNSVTAKIVIEGDEYFIDMEGPEATSAYAEQLPHFLEIGKQALKITEQVKQKPEQWPAGLSPPAEDKMWDPQNTGTWHFFMPLGMAMLNQKAVNFFHYPPLRLLDPMRDYLKDPVPVRLIELMRANGLQSEQQAWLYSTVMDCAPIAAPDDQGTQYIGTGSSQQTVHLLPIDQYHSYQKAQVNMLLNSQAANDQHTVPVVVYGTSARRAFSELYLDGVSLGKSKPVEVEIVKGKKTAVIGADHPYRFFAQAQISDSTGVGLGHILEGKYEGVKALMVDDLAIVRWQVLMGEDPSQAPQEVFNACKGYWTNRDTEREDMLNALVQHQGSLFYASDDSLDFSFKVPLADETQM